MDLNAYQTAALQTAIYPNMGVNFAYPALGLVGEAGEVADKLKKVIRDNDGVLPTQSATQSLRKLVMCCGTFPFSLTRWTTT
jgi:NTP pyrophosphatase (non-canonical NTP hydrolase)